MSVASSSLVQTKQQSSSIVPGTAVWMVSVTLAKEHSPDFLCDVEREAIARVCQAIEGNRLSRIGSCSLIYQPGALQSEAFSSIACEATPLNPQP